MFGLWIAREGACGEEEIRQLLARQLIPLEGFVDAQAFPCGDDMNAFLRSAACAVMLGQPLPMAGVARFLSGSEAMPGNVIRKYVCLQLSLMPYLRRGVPVVQGEGCWLLGDSLLVAPMEADGRVDAQLPPGVWTEMATGECVSGTFRRLRGLNAMPVLAGENCVIPVGVDDRSPRGDDADRLTLHWFQPGEHARCTLADGTEYRLSMRGGVPEGESTSEKTWHLIVHQDGQELFVR